MAPGKKGVPIFIGSTDKISEWKQQDLIFFAQKVRLLADGYLSEKGDRSDTPTQAPARYWSWEEDIWPAEHKDKQHASVNNKYWQKVCRFPKKFPEFKFKVMCFGSGEIEMKNGLDLLGKRWSISSVEKLIKSPKNSSVVRWLLWVNMGGN